MAQQAGFLDRVFNSTISLPQQVIWRIWRALEEDDVDLFSEKGLLDAALIPFFGVADSHKHDVMPDWAAAKSKEYMGGSGREADTGLTSQLTAAILLDPLTYMTGGVSALGKVGKAAVNAGRVKALSNTLRNAAKAAKMPLNKYMDQLAPVEYLKQIDSAIAAVEASPASAKAARQKKFLESTKTKLERDLPQAERLHQMRALEALEGGATGPARPLTMGEAIKKTNDKQIAIGLPVLSRWGAKYDVSEGTSDWWTIYKEGINKTSTGLGKALLLNKLQGTPLFGSLAKAGAVQALAGFGKGWRIGQEAQAAMVRGSGVTREEADTLNKWLSPEGAAQVAKDTREASQEVGGQEELISRIVARYEKGVNEQNLMHEEAFRRAMRSVGIGQKNETGAALWGRLNGRTNQNTYFPEKTWADGTSRGKRDIAAMLNNMMEQHAKASKMRRQGNFDITPEFTEVHDLAETFQKDISELSPTFEYLAQKSFDAGRALKVAKNTMFHSGQATRVGEKAYGKYLAQVASANDEVEQLTKSLYTKLRNITKGEGDLTMKEISTLVAKTIELDVPPDELAASFRFGDMNPSDAGKVLESLDNFMNRQRNALTSIEKLLHSKGFNKESRQALIDAFDEEIFPFLELEGEQEMVGVFDRIIKNNREDVFIYTPWQRKHMRQKNNRYIIQGHEIPLTERQLAAQAAGKTPRPRRALSKLIGKPAGTLQPQELDSAIAEIEEFGQRALTQDEIIARAEQMPEIKQFAEQNGLSVSATLQALGKSGKAQTRIVSDTVMERPALWKQERTRWRGSDVADAANPYGFNLVRDEETGLYNFVSSRVKDSTLKRSYGFNPKKGYRTYRAAMADLHEFLSTNEKYVKRYGPGLEETTKRIAISDEKLEWLRKALGEENLQVLRGKGTTFDDAVLPGTLATDYDRLTALRKRRALPEGHRLKAQVVNPVKQRRTTLVAPPRSSDEFELYLEKHGGINIEEGQMSDWARNYARGRLLMREVRLAIKRSIDEGVPVNIDPQILDDIQQHIGASGAVIRDIMEAHLPKAYGETMDVARQIGARSFEAAYRSGVWIPGSPVAYLPRFFNKAGRARISHLFRDIAQSDGDILTRLGVSQSQYHQRSFDDLPIEDLNALHAELREAALEKGASPRLAKFQKRLDKEMERAGIGVSGFAGKLPYTKTERIQDDPFLPLLQRFNIAQQDKGLSDYFNNMLAANTGKNGESTMLAGKVIGIVDDTGDVHSIPQKKYKIRSKDKTGGVEQVALREETEYLDWTPKSLVIQLDDGTRHTVEAGMFEESGFGILSLGKGRDAGFARSAMEEAAEESAGGIGNRFAAASLRSDLHNNMHRGRLESTDALKLLENHVVFGAEANIVGMVKSAAQVHKVTPPALRTFDAINYGIKSFQTIFRLPFHIANLSSGVFQAHLAGATPKNLVASYWDTMRFLMGNQDFARQASMVTDLLDVNSDAHSLGFVNLMKGEKPQLLEAVRMQGNGEFADFLQQRAGVDDLTELDSFEDLVISLPNGTEIDMREFIMLAGERQLYGTFASSITRGSRGIADNLMRIKMATLEPTLGGRLMGVPKKLMEKMTNLSETSEVINRTATALALVREGHTMSRAIEIAKEAHVPYEKLTPFERNKLKRFSVYYTFPRHYMPWAWARFAEDPAKLARISHFIRDQNVVSTQEGKPNLVVGDYRVDLARLNANFEAAGLLAAFADRYAMPAGEAIGVNDAYDARRLRSVYSDAGIANVGGIAGMFFGNHLLTDPDRDMPKQSPWHEATQVAWPMKIAAQIFGRAPKEGVVTTITGIDEKSPYVEYTPLEAWLTDSVFGLPARKVRAKHELVRANMQYQRMIQRLKMRAAATEDPEKRKRYIGHARDLAAGLRQIVSETQQKDYQ